MHDADQLPGRTAGYGREAKSILQERNGAAIAIAKKMELAENERRAALRLDCARKVATWANQHRFQSDSSRDHLDRIEANARIRMQRAVADLKPILIRPSDAMPDKVLSRTSFDKFRYDGASQISDKLNRNRILIRVPPKFKPASATKAAANAPIGNNQQEVVGGIFRPS